MDTWRTWELVLPELERRHDVLAPTLPGHAGGPRIAGAATIAAAADAVERVMDEAALATAHVVGNSLGGFLALELAVRGRARSVVALAPAGGWPAEDTAFAEALVTHFATLRQLLQAAAPYADAIVATAEGRRRATEFIAERFDHIPRGLLAHLIRGAATCEVAAPMLESALRDAWRLDPERIACPVRIVWGTADRVLTWPHAAARFRGDWLPHADWIELDGVGHCPQLDVPLETAQLIVGFTAQSPDRDRPGLRSRTS